MVKFATISTFSKQFISKIKRDIRRNAQHQCAKHLSEKHATELHEYYLIFDFLRRTKSTEEIRLIVAAIARWHKREDAPFELWLNVKKKFENWENFKNIFSYHETGNNRRWTVEKCKKQQKLHLFFSGLFTAVSILGGICGFVLQYWLTLFYWSTTQWCPWVVGFGIIRIIATISLLNLNYTFIIDYDRIHLEQFLWDKFEVVI